MTDCPHTMDDYIINDSDGSMTCRICERKQDAAE